MTTIFTIATLGQDISSRTRAADLRHALLAAVPNGPVHLDFAGVRTISDSFADELFAVLVAERGEEWFREHLRLINLAPALRATILEAISERSHAS